MAPLQAASSTSLMLPPAASPIAFIRAMLVDCVATRRCGVMAVLKIVRGASASDAKSGLSLRPMAALADPARPRSRLGKACAWLEQRGRQHPHGPGRCDAAARLALALLRPDRRRAGLLRILGEIDQPDAGDAVGQRVVHLAVHGEAAAVQALDQVHFPQRAVHVHRVRVQTRDQHAELALTARVWQGRVAQVVVEVHLLDLVPAWQQPSRAHAAQPVIERRRGDREAAQVFVDLLREVARRPGRWQEGLQSGDVHRRLARLHQHEAQVEQVEGLGVGHGESPVGNRLFRSAGRTAISTDAGRAKLGRIATVRLE